MKSGFCVLWGRPNVGKSTLLNALLGRKHAIVTPRPQTTRHRITGVLHGEDSQIVFLDTPGIHEPRHKLGERLVQTARGALEDVECVLFVGDISDSPHDDDRRAAELLARVRAPLLLVLNKSDRCDQSALAHRRQEFEALVKSEATIEVSALEGTNVVALRDAILARLPEGDPYFPTDMIGDRPVEFHVEELIREQAMLQLHQELPHSVAVGVEQMEPRPQGKLYIEAVINIERESQKGMVVGQGGARIKAIGLAAREEIQRHLGRPVYLDLRVKVREKWRDNEVWIKRLGYEN